MLYVFCRYSSKFAYQTSGKKNFEVTPRKPMDLYSKILFTFYSIFIVIPSNDCHLWLFYSLAKT